MEQANFKFCFELGKTAKSANKRLQTGYANDASSRLQAIQRMFGRRLHKVQKQIQNAIDHRMTPKLENQLHVNRERIGDTIRKDFENAARSLL
jgi:RecJ-like exonuclease